MASGRPRPAIDQRRNSLLSFIIPVLRAYGLAYASTTAPRFLNLLFIIAKKKQSTQQLSTSIYNILKGSIDLHRFPAFCAALVGGYTFLQKPIRHLYHYACISFISHNGKRWGAQKLEIAIGRFIAAFVSAWFSLKLLNTPNNKSEVPERVANQSKPDIRMVRSITDLDSSKAKPLSHQEAGKTIDLTLFAATRALETLIVNIWRHQSKKSRSPPSKTSSLLSHNTDALVFAASCSMIMYSWFYRPKNLPRGYNKWIASAAQVDPHLIEALRLAHCGQFVYGEDKGPEARQCQGMCREYGWPIEWGDPQITVPIPCEMVHMGAGPNCHWHACVRFVRAFKFALATNFPLQLLAKLISKRRLTAKDLVGITRDSARSSAFLGAFIALFYYGICLSRTQVGPRIFSEKTISRQDWDSGLCVKVACALCGWSILIEAERRRGELAMFVAPRAAATVLPRSYDRQYFWRERMAFSVSTALLFTLAQEGKGKVRGVLGRLLNGVLS